MFNSFEEIKKRYPIGKPLRMAPEVTHNVFYYTQKDLEIYRKMYKNVTITGENTCRVTTPERVALAVEGYIFDGEKFYPAYTDWDGWQVWIEEE